MKNGKRKMENILKIFLFVGVFGIGVLAQSSEPKPSAPKSVKIPAVKESKLKNGLTVAVVERKGVPLVSVQLLIKSGAELEDKNKAGLANLTADLLTKGTKTRSATQIAEEIDFLGASLNTEANWNSTSINLNVMSEKLEPAFSVMSDAVLNPAFKQEELDLLKSQSLDGLTYNLSQPGFLANYVASTYSFNKHPVNGTVQSISGITQDDLIKFHKLRFVSDDSVLIFVGDITLKQAEQVSEKFFGNWQPKKEFKLPEGTLIIKGTRHVSGDDLKENENQSLVKRLLVIDLPNSGQASVTFARTNKLKGRVFAGTNGKGTTVSDTYYPAIALNSLLGGGYSSRLNQEIRIKRGLSYGAGSSFAWQFYSSDFSTRTQTKNQSAAEVAELVTAEIKRLSEGEIPESELNPRRLVLTGGFGRNLETNQGLASAIADLYAFSLPAETLNSYSASVMAVKDKQIKQFAAENFKGGDIIIVGDYAVFKDDLAKRFPGMTVEVIKADELDITQENLRKSGQ